MPPPRLLAFAVCGYLTPSLRRPISVQPYRSYRHLSNSIYRERLLSFPAVPHVYSVGAAMSMTRATHDGESIAAATDGNEQEVVGLDTAVGVYRYLRGCWDLEKSIDYRAGGMAGTWHGTATFTPREGSSSPTTTSTCVGATPTPTAEHRDRQPTNHEADDTLAEKTCGIRRKKPSRLLLRYLERGTFRISGKGEGFEAGQRLVYDCGEYDTDHDGAGPVRVHFVDDPSKPNDLRFFHELEFRRPSAAAAAKEDNGGEGGLRSGELGVNPRAEFEHLCVRDMYRGQVEVVGPDEFTTRWHVTGPQKDGRIIATYRRSAAGETVVGHR